VQKSGLEKDENRRRITDLSLVSIIKDLSLLSGKGKINKRFSKKGGEPEI